MCLTYVFKIKFLIIDSLNNALRALVSITLLLFIETLLLKFIHHEIKVIGNLDLFEHVNALRVSFDMVVSALKFMIELNGII